MKRATLIATLIFAIVTIASAQSKTQNPEVLKYIEHYYPYAIRDMVKYRIPASIKLAQGILESNWGKSNLAQRSNNHFGIKCKSSWSGDKVYHDDDELQECFRSYDNVYDSFQDHSEFLATGKRYAFLFEYSTQDYKAWAKGLKKAGYATNPVYANKLIEIIELYELYKYDQYKKYGINPKGVVKETPVEEKIHKKRKPVEVVAPVMVNKVTTIDEDNFGRIVERIVGNKSGRTLFERNGVRYIKAESGDTWSGLAAITRKKATKLYGFNDVVDPMLTIEEGQFVFVAKKKKSSPMAGSSYTIPEDGLTLLTISQHLGINVEALCEENSLRPNERLQQGRVITLK